MVHRKRRGAIVVFAAILLVILLGVLAFSLDVGYMQFARSDMQHAADAAALAGTAALPKGNDQAFACAKEFAVWNVPEHLSEDDVEPVAGHWIADTRTFDEGGAPVDALQVTLHRESVPLFFGRFLGSDSFDVSAKATATYRPRDIMLVLDFSGSMNNHNRIDALKESVGLFFEILDDGKQMDRVGFVRYSTQAELEIQLTNNYNSINNIVQQELADGWTNIGDGMNFARNELADNARPNAVKMMVLMTDGKVNKPANRSPSGYVLEEAQLAAEAGIQMVSISFGSDADKSLMQQVATIAKGVFFDVDDSNRPRDSDLHEVFEKIAQQRPVVLVD
jgi:Mg-chelatase subunit ChlD